MGIFPFDTMKKCMEVMAYKLSDHEMEPYVRQKMNDCLESSPSPRQLFDCMAEISKLPCERRVINGQRVAVGDISGFIQATCDVEAYYVRPAAVAGETKGE